MTGSIGNNREKISADSVLKSDAEEFGMTAADLLTNKAATTLPKTSSRDEFEELFALVDDVTAKNSDPFEGVELSEQPKQPTATVTRVASQAFKPDELTETDSSDDEGADLLKIEVSEDMEVSDDMTEELQPQRPPTERDLRLSKTASQILGDVGKELGMEPSKRAVSQEVKPASVMEEARPASFGKNKDWKALGTVLSPFSKFGDLLASGKDRVVGAFKKFGDGVRGAVRKCCENIKLPERHKTKNKIESVTSYEGEWQKGDPQKLQKAAQKQPLTAEQKERQRDAYAKRFDELFKGIDSDKMADRLVEIVHNENLNKNFMEIATFAGADPKEVKEFVELYQRARVGANIDSHEMEETKGDLAYKDLAVNQRRQNVIKIAEEMRQRLGGFLEGVRDALRSA